MVCALSFLIALKEEYPHIDFKVWETTGSGRAVHYSALQRKGRALVEKFKPLDREDLRKMMRCYDSTQVQPRPVTTFNCFFKIYSATSNPPKKQHP